MKGWVRTCHASAWLAAVLAPLLGCSAMGEQPLGVGGVEGGGGASGDADGAEPAYVRRAISKTPLGGYPWSFVARDFTGDGFTDVAALICEIPAVYNPITWVDCTVVVLFGDGTGHLSSPNPLPSLLRSYQDLKAGDFTGDGVLDLVAFTGPYNYAVTLWRGLGNGAFDEPKETVLTCQEDGGDYDVTPRLYPGSFRDAAVQEVFLPCKRNSPRAVLRYDALLQSMVETLVPAMAPCDWPAGVGDFNGDGLTDCIGYEGGYGIFTAKGGYDFTVVDPSSPKLKSLGSSTILGVGDLNRDGHLDAVFSFASMLGRGDGTFDKFIAYHPLADGPVGDLSGDGWLDLATLDLGTNSLKVMYGDPMKQGIEFKAHSISGPRVVAPADLDGDDVMEVLVDAAWDLVVLSGQSFRSLTEQ